MIRKGKPSVWHYLFMVIAVVIVTGSGIVAASMSAQLYARFTEDATLTETSIRIFRLAGPLGFALGGLASFIWTGAMVWWTGRKTRRELFLQGAGLAIALGVGTVFVSHLVYSNIISEWKTLLYVFSALLAAIFAAVIGSVGSAIWAFLPLRSHGD